MKTADLLTSLRNMARDEWAEDIIDQLETAYLEDSSIFEEKISGLEGTLGERDTSISALKNELYDMSKLVPSDKSSDESDEEVDETTPSDNPIDDLPDIEDFFTPVEEDK